MCYKLARGGQLTNQTTTSRIVTSQNYFINLLELEKQDFGPLPFHCKNEELPKSQLTKIKNLQKYTADCHKSQKYAEMCSTCSP